MFLYCTLLIEPYNDITVVDTEFGHCVYHRQSTVSLQCTHTYPSTVFLVIFAVCAKFNLLLGSRFHNG